MAAEQFLTGLGIFKALYDSAKALKDINDAAIRNGAVVELQEKILAAHEAQTALLSRVGELEKEVASFETWNAEKERYELKEIGHGITAYAVKPDAQGAEPAHSICPDCYTHRVKSFLQQVTRNPGRAQVLICQQCQWEAYVQGSWHPEHGAMKSASRRPR